MPKTIDCGSSYVLHMCLCGKYHTCSNNKEKMKWIKQHSRFCSNAYNFTNYGTPEIDTTNYNKNCHERRTDLKNKPHYFAPK
jgi:hypothetical protein